VSPGAPGFFPRSRDDAIPARDVAAERPAQGVPLKSSAHHAVLNFPFADLSADHDAANGHVRPLEQHVSS
jgi:hypothetical protein